jgi:hypothetical protein
MIQGEYYFRQTEMVAGFKFSDDGTFQFFFSYGAVDRHAAGTFSVEGNLVKLKSGKEPGKDFTVNREFRQGEGYHLVFTHTNSMLVQNIRCFFLVGDKREDAITDSQGRIQLDIPHCDSIYVQHLLFPDIVTLVKSTDNKNNHFELSLNPSLEQVSFKGIDFTIEEDGTLSCHPNYFMPMPGIRFLATAASSNS